MLRRLPVQLISLILGLAYLLSLAASFHSVFVTVIAVLVSIGLVYAWYRYRRRFRRRRSGLEALAASEDPTPAE